MPKARSELVRKAQALAKALAVLRGAEAQLTALPQSSSRDAALTALRERREALQGLRTDMAKQAQKRAVARSRAAPAADAEPD